MNSKAKNKVPKSGDIIVDWIFREFLGLLRSEQMTIIRKKNVGKGLMGYAVLATDGSMRIAVSSSRKMHKNRRKELETFVHELFHLLCWQSKERRIRKVDVAYVKKLTKKQRKMLLSFLEPD